MKRWWILLGIAAMACLLSPFQGTDVGKLRPAQWVYLSRDGETVLVRTDLGDLGKGGGVGEALGDLMESAPGALFLDTADYILVSPECADLLPNMGGWVRGAAEVYVTAASPDEETGAFLEAHRGKTLLRDCMLGTQALSVLTRDGERWILIDG